jgi:hypothetical protein
MLQPVKKDEKLYAPRTLIFLNPFDINFTTWNPASRSNPRKKSLLALAESLVDYDLYIPALIDEYGNLIDGNRRVLAARLVRENYGQEIQIMCTVCDTSVHSAEEIFAQVNAHREAIGGADMLEIYLKNPRALPEKLRQKMQIMEQAFGGKQSLSSLVEEGLTYRAYERANLLQKYLSSHKPPTLHRICEWMIKYNLAHRMDLARKYGMSPTFITDRIKKDLPISSREVKDC